MSMLASRCDYSQSYCMFQTLQTAWLDQCNHITCDTLLKLQNLIQMLLVRSLFILQFAYCKHTPLPGVSIKLLPNLKLDNAACSKLWDKWFMEEVERGRAPLLCKVPYIYLLLTYFPSEQWLYNEAGRNLIRLFWTVVFKPFFFSLPRKLEVNLFYPCGKSTGN